MTIAGRTKAYVAVLDSCPPICFSLQGPPPPPSARPATPGPTLPPEVQGGWGGGVGTVGSRVGMRAGQGDLRETTEVPEYDLACARATASGECILCQAGAYQTHLLL